MQCLETPAVASSPSIVQNELTSALPTSAKKRRLTSDVWKHYNKVKVDGKDRAICSLCKSDFSWSNKTGTSNLRKHWSICSGRKKTCSSETGDLKNPTVINGDFVVDEERSGLDVVRMVMKHKYPLNMVEHEFFKFFVKNLQPMFKLQPQDTLKGGILHVYKEEKEKLHKNFNMLSCCFHLILNFWACHDKMDKYCCLTLQFSEDGLKLKEKILALKKLEYNYTGETLCEIVKGVLSEWKIEKKLCSITTECSSSNNQMATSLNTWLTHQGCPPHRKKLFYIPCITNIINLLVQDGLDEVDYILYRIRKAIKYLSETTNGKQVIEVVVKKLNLQGKDITFQGVPISWDSIVFMLRSALELREAFSDLQSTDCDFHTNLSMTEWDMAEVIHECLTVFHDSVRSFLESKCSTNVYFCKICDIHKYLLLRQTSEKIITRSIASKMRMRFDKYLEFCIWLSGTVAVFDPRTKLESVRNSLEEIYGQDTRTYSRIKDDLEYIFDGYAKDLSSQGLSSSFINNENSSSYDTPKKFKAERDSQRPELDQYLKEPILDSHGEFDILAWWHTNSSRFPTLWRMARDILSIPMSTSISNSVFSIESTTINPIFNDLDSEIIEALVCGEGWLDNPITTRITPNKDNEHSPEPTSTPLVFAETSLISEPQEKHAPCTANTELGLLNSSSTSSPESLPTCNVSLTLSTSSVSSQNQEKHISSTANAVPVFENLGSTLGTEQHPTGETSFVWTGTLESQENHDPVISTNADTTLMLANRSSTLCPELIPTGIAPQTRDILGRNEAQFNGHMDESQGLQHNRMRSQEYSWSPPPKTWFKVNVDAVVNSHAAVNDLYYTCCGAVVTRNDEGKIVDANTAIGTATCLQMAKVLVFRFAVQLIQQNSVHREAAIEGVEPLVINKVIIEGDEPSVVNTLKDRKTRATEIYTEIFQQIFDNLDQCADTNVEFSCVDKICNSTAHACSQWALKNDFYGSIPLCWFSGDSFIGPRI